MDSLVLAAALTSALLHAAWNAAVKASVAPGEAMAAQMIAAALLSLVGLAFVGLPPPAAWPWIAASTLLNMVAVTALLRAYLRGGFGSVYPAVRAISVLSVAALTPSLFGERLAPLAMAGVGLVVAGLALLALDGRGDAVDGRGFPRAAWPATLTAGVLVAGYVLADAGGVRAAGSAWTYGFALSVANAIGIAWLQRRGGSPWGLLRRHARLALPAALASMVSYLLILWVFQRAPVALAAALRDTSALFAMLIAVIWLNEPLRPARVAALLVALAGVPLLRLT